MLIFLVFFVSMNMPMIRTEGNIISIEINKNLSQKTCNISKEVTLRQQSNFTLKIKSDFFIYKSRWLIYDKENSILPDNKTISNLPHSDLNMTFQKSIGSNKNNETKTSIYFILNVRDQEVPESSQNWTFKFELLDNYDPWSFEKPNIQDIQEWSCETFVKINTSSVRSSSKAENNRTSRVPTDKTFPGPSRVPTDKTFPDKETYWVLIAVIVSLLLAQTSYIVYRKIRSRKLKNKNNDKDPVSLEERRGSKPERNIANRAPLPLPLDEIIKNEPLPPVPESPIPHGQPCYYYASSPYMPADNSNKCEPDPLPIKSYINKGLETSEERVTSSAIARRHMEASFVPKQPYRHKASDISEDEINNREISRRLTQGPVIPKQSYNNKVLGHSVKEIRSPNFSRSHEGPLVQKESYRNKALANSLEELKSPNFGRRHEGPLVPKQSFKNTALDDVDEEVQTPGFARRQIEAKLAQFPPKIPSKSIKNPSPVVPQKPYRNAALDDFDEEIKTPGLARRQIEAKLTQLPSREVGPSKTFKSPVILQKPYRKAAFDDSDEEMKTPGLARRPSDTKLAQLPSKGFSPSISFKIPKPLPRTSSSSSPPPSPPEKPAFHPARRQEPGPPSPPPPLLPKKPSIPEFLPQEACRPQDSRRFSDDEWQYEKLEPISKYLDDFTVKPYE